MNRVSNLDYLKLANEVWKQHNVIRTNPQSYVPILEERMKYFKENILERPDLDFGIQTIEGIDAYIECIEFLKRQEALEEFVLDNELSNACLDHANDIGPKGVCDHTGTNGSTVDVRVAKYLDWNVMLTENIDFGFYSGVDVIVSLIVDDGVPERQHRSNIFNPKLKVFGLAVANHAIFDTLVVIDYCGHVSSYKKDQNQETQRSQEEERLHRVTNLVDSINSREKYRHYQLHAEKPSDHPIFNHYNTVSYQGGLIRNYDNSELLSRDVDAPKNAVQVSTKVTTKIIGKKTEKKTSKTYTLDDGSTETLILEELIE
jgi:hypothetical protein